MSTPQHRPRVTKMTGEGNTAQVRDVWDTAPHAPNGGTDVLSASAPTPAEAAQQAVEATCKRLDESLPRFMSNATKETYPAAETRDKIGPAHAFIAESGERVTIEIIDTVNGEWEPNGHDHTGPINGYALRTVFTPSFRDYDNGETPIRLDMWRDEDRIIRGRVVDSYTNNSVNAPQWMLQACEKRAQDIGGPNLRFLVLSLNRLPEES